MRKMGWRDEELVFQINRKTDNKFSRDNLKSVQENEKEEQPYHPWDCTGPGARVDFAHSENRLSHLYCPGEHWFTSFFVSFHPVQVGWYCRNNSAPTLLLWKYSGLCERSAATRRRNILEASCGCWGRCLSEKQSWVDGWGQAAWSDGSDTTGSRRPFTSRHIAMDVQCSSGEFSSRLGSLLSSYIYW